MNVDRRWWGTSVVGIRFLVAGTLLLGTGSAFLGWGNRFGRSVRNQSPQSSFGIEPKGELQARARSIFNGLPLIFEPNQGQANLDPTDPRAKFVTHGGGYSVALGSEGATLSLVYGKGTASRVQTLRMKLVGANSQLSLKATDPLPGKTNYFIGNNPARWRTGVPQFARVRYEDAYPGIDLVFYGNQGHLEYDFQVAPGADPAQPELEFGGATKLELENGSLVIYGENRSLRLEAPRVYQEIDGQQQTVEGAFVLRSENRVGFAIGTYDHSRELIIDPILNFSSYFGGSGDDRNTSVAVDGNLNIYLTGSTQSADLPATAGVLQTTLNGAQNVYVAKIQPPLGSTAAQLLELTYLGGSGTDYPVGIKVDGQGNAFLAGTTTSGDFPTTPTTAYQEHPVSAGTHVFVTKLKFDFSAPPVYSSYLSGNGTDIASGMTIDPAGNLYVTGTTTSVETSNRDQFPASNLPQTLPFQSLPRATSGTAQFFVTKVNTNAPKTGSIPYSTYFGGGTFSGTAVVTGGGIAVDSNLNVYFTGTTNFTYSGTSIVTDFPILNAYQPCLNSPPATTIVNGQPCGTTTNPTLPDAFVAKLNTNTNVPPGQQLIWSTYVGGTQTDSGAGVALDSGAANVYVVGTTNSGDFINSNAPRSYASYQTCLNNLTADCNSTTGSLPADAFVARLNNPGTGTTNVALNYFSYLGGQNDEEGLAITVDTNSGALITGSTTSPFTAPSGTDGNFPIFPFPSSIQGQLNGTRNAFIARLNTVATTGQATTASWASYFGGNDTDRGTGIALDVNQNTYLAGETNSTTQLQVAKALQASNKGGFDAFVAQLTPAISLSIQGVLSLGTGQQFISAGNPATFTYTVTNNGPDSASNIVMTADLSTAVTGVALSNVSATVSSGTCGGGGTSNASLSCGPIALQSGSTATMTITATPTANSSGTSPVSFNGGTVQAIAPGNIVLAQTSVPAQMTDFDMSVKPGNQAVAVAGETATYTVQLTPRPLYTSSITISCSNLPAATSCTPSASPVTLSNAGGASVALSLATTARPTTTASIFTQRFYAVWLMIPGLALVGMGGTRRRRRVFGFLGLCMLFALTLLIPACSSSSQQQAPVAGTPAGDYTITVTAAAGSDAKSQTIGLHVP